MNHLRELYNKGDGTDLGIHRACGAVMELIDSIMLIGDVVIFLFLQSSAHSLFATLFLNRPSIQVLFPNTH